MSDAAELALENTVFRQKVKISDLEAQNEALVKALEEIRDASAGPDHHETCNDIAKQALSDHRGEEE